MSRLLVGFALLLAGCAVEPQVVVQLVTDLRPGQEFDGIEVTVTNPAGAVLAHAETRAAASGYGRPARLLEAPVDGLVRVDVALTFDGRPVAAGHRRTTAVGRTVATVLIERVCRDIACAPDSVCLQASCVDDRCTDERRESCPTSVCTIDGDCAAPGGDCLRAACVSGRCLALPDDGLCGGALRCDALAGCVDPRPACVDPEPFAAPELLFELPAENASAPALTPDELHMVFEGGPSGAFQIFQVDRASRTEPFAGPARVVASAIDPTRQIADPVLRYDGLELLYVSYDELDYGCVFRATRPAIDASFGPRVRIAALCEAQPPNVFLSGDARSVYAIHDSARPHPLTVHRRGALDAEFEVGESLGVLDGGTGSLSRDGLTLFYEARPTTAGPEEDSLDVWSTQRDSVDAPFPPGAVVEELSIHDFSVADGDPEISDDGRTIYFFSRRFGIGTRRIWVAHRRCAGDP